MNVAAKKSKTTEAQALRSRYEYKDYFHTDDGKRIPIDVHFTKKRTANLINTCIFNPKKSTYTLYMLQFDLDFDKVRDARFIENGKISWSAVQNYIAEHHSYLFKNIFSATRSFSGRGLSIGLSISPIELKSENSEKCERLARAVERKIQQAFVIAGCGLDTGATGLKRLCANWKNPAKREYWAPHVKRFNECNRPAALKELMEAMNQDPLLAYKKKRDQLDELLCHDIRAERGFSKLYIHLLDENYSAQMSTKEVVQLTGLSEKTCLKYLKNGFAWLSTEFISKFEGWCLTLQPEHKLSARAFQLCESMQEKKSDCPGDSFEFVEAKHPSLVGPDERNQQLTGWLLRLKWRGIEESEAIDIVQSLAEQIPSSESSRNCRAISTKACSLYRHHPETFNCQAQVDYPNWLLDGANSESSKFFRSTEGSPLLEEASVLPLKPFAPTLPKVEQQSPTYLSFADLTPREAQVGPDQHFQYRANSFKNRAGRIQWRYSFYSVPKGYRKVLVFEKDGQLYVFSTQDHKFLCQHKLKKTPNKFSTVDDHVSADLGKSYIDWISQKSFISRSQQARWKSMLELSGFEAIRKIQQEFRSLSKVEGEVQ